MRVSFTAHFSRFYKRFSVIFLTHKKTIEKREKLTLKLPSISIFQSLSYRTKLLDQVHCLVKCLRKKNQQNKHRCKTNKSFASIRILNLKLLWSDWMLTMEVTLAISEFTINPYNTKWTSLRQMWHRNENVVIYLYIFFH